MKCCCCKKKNQRPEKNSGGGELLSYPMRSQSSNHEFLEFMNNQSTIGEESNRVGSAGHRKSALLSMARSSNNLTSFLDRPYHVIMDEYYQCEPDGTGSWKTYDTSAFQTVKINIGRGTTSKVHLMLHRKSGFLGVMKILPTYRSEEARTELNVLNIVRESPFLIRLIDGFLAADETFYIFMEYAPFRTLDHLTQALKGIGSANSSLYGLEIACGIDFLHNRDIMHRDIKPENVCILISGHVALGDFGSSMIMSGPTITSRFCGTYVTRPPEVWNRKTYNKSVDIWEFGMTLFNIISNGWPIIHPSKEKQIFLVNRGKIIFPSVFSDDAADLIMRMLQVDPDHRWTTAQIVKHKYFEGISEPYAPPFSPTELQTLYDFGDEGTLIKELVLQLHE